MEAVTVHN